MLGQQLREAFQARKGLTMAGLNAVCAALVVIVSALTIGDTPKQLVILRASVYVGCSKDVDIETFLRYCLPLFAI